MLYSKSLLLISFMYNKIILLYVSLNPILLFILFLPPPLSPLEWHTYLLTVLTTMRLLEKAMAPHSSTLAGKIPWTEEPGRLQSLGSLRAGHDWATSLSLIREGNGNPLLCSCLENPRDGEAWWAVVCGVTQSQTRLKRLSSSSILFKRVFHIPAGGAGMSRCLRGNACS